MFCDDPEEWDKGHEGRLKKGGICIYNKTDSCYCTAETNTALWSNHPPIKNKFKKLPPKKKKTKRVSVRVRESSGREHVF